MKLDGSDSEKPPSAHCDDFCELAAYCRLKQNKCSQYNSLFMELTLCKSFLNQLWIVNYLNYEILETLSCFDLQAEIGRHSTPDREWEVYRFLLEENCEFQFLNMVGKNQIVDRVRRLLMGW